MTILMNENMTVPDPSPQDKGEQLKLDMTSNSYLINQRDYWLAQSAGWGGLGLIWAFSSGVEVTESFVRFALAKVFCITTGFCLSHLWRGFLKRRAWLEIGGVFPFKNIFLGLLLLSLIQCCFLLLSDVIFRNAALFEDGKKVLGFVLFLTFLWFAVFLIWTLLYAMAQAQRRAVRFGNEKLQLQVNVKDAELRALQAQINPHFFFNSLNTIRALVYQDPDAAANAIGKLAGMMRHSLQAGQSETVRLADEMRAVEAYLSMEKLRFEDRMQVDIECEAGIEDTALPPMMLQTLVENAVKHGVERSQVLCQIKISANTSPSGDSTVLRVANQGQLGLASNSTHIGLANTSKRLALLYGEKASCTMIEENGWVVARIVLPRKLA